MRRPISIQRVEQTATLAEERMVTSCFCGRILKPSIRDKKSRFFLRFQLNNMVNINPTGMGRQEFIRFHNGKGCILPLLPRGRKGALYWSAAA